MTKLIPLGGTMQVIDTKTGRVNAMPSGGWISLEDWGRDLVPWLLKECVPRADGQWSITHAIEVARSMIQTEVA